MALASTYHSIAATAAAQTIQMIRRDGVWLIFCLIMTVFTYNFLYKTVPGGVYYINIIYSIIAVIALPWIFFGGYCWVLSLLHAWRAYRLLGKNASADHLDIYSSILLVHGLRKTAKKIIYDGLSLNPEPHTEALLTVNLAKILLSEGEYHQAFRCLNIAIILAIKVIEKEPEQAYRVCEKCAEILLGSKELRKKDSFIATQARIDEFRHKYSTRGKIAPINTILVHGS